MTTYQERISDESFQCTGCENECEVVIRHCGEKILWIDGNLCPTGSTYAEALFRRRCPITHQAQEHLDRGNGIK